MEGLINALQFLTVLRLKRRALTDEEGLGSSWVYFPLVGALLGVVLVALGRALSPFMPSTLLSLILVFTLVILSGGMHIDGLADSCDALFSGKNKEEALCIMRDCHKGTFGVLAIIADILFKVYLLSSVPLNLKTPCLLSMTVLSRYSMTIGIAFFPYARKEGKAKAFFQEKGLKNFLFSTLITLIIMALIPKIVGLAVLFFVVIFTLLICLYLKRRISGLSGDTLGALSELNELLVLSLFLTVGGFNI